MEEFIIKKDNKITNRVLGRPEMLAEGETIEVSTGSFANIIIGDYYLTDSDTYYSPLQPQVIISPTGSTQNPTGGNPVMGINSGSYHVEVLYTENIINVTSACITVDKMDISNFTTLDNGFTFDIIIKNEFTGSGDQDTQISYQSRTNNICDSHNNPVLSYMEGFNEGLKYIE